MLHIGRMTQRWQKDARDVKLNRALALAFRCMVVFSSRTDATFARSLDCHFGLELYFCFLFEKKHSIKKERPEKEAEAVFI